MTTPLGSKRPLPAAPRGRCAGVDRPVQTVERAQRCTEPPSAYAMRSSTAPTSSGP